MKAWITVALLLTLAACADEPARTDTAPPEGESTSSTAARTYTMNGVLLSRDAGRNTVHIDNEDVPGVMPPMKMDYELRGAEVDALPPDGSRVTMTLHELNGSYWVTDVRAR